MTIRTLDRESLSAIAREADRTGVAPELSLTLPATQTSFSEQLEGVAREVAETTGWPLTVAFDSDIGSHFLVTVGDRVFMRYQAIPAGREAAPFMDGLRLLVTSDSGSTPVLDEHTEIDVFISSDCPNCPVTVRAANLLAAVSDRVEVTVIDVAEFPDRAAAAGVRSVPLAIVNDGLTLVGAMSAAELAGRISATTEILPSLIDAGRFDAAAAELVSGRGSEAFLDLWRKSSLESRIGLVLTAEAALERDPRCLDPLVAALAEVANDEDAGRRGDTADLLGSIGHPDARPTLERLLEDAMEDVAEIAADALDELVEDVDR